MFKSVGAPKNDDKIKMAVSNYDTRHRTDGEGKTDSEPPDIMESRKYCNRMMEGYARDAVCCNTTRSSNNITIIICILF